MGLKADAMGEDRNHKINKKKNGKPMSSKNISAAFPI
jgi:hypothetical protein